MTQLSTIEPVVCEEPDDRTRLRDVESAPSAFSYQTTFDIMKRRQAERESAGRVEKLQSATLQMLAIFWICLCATISSYSHRNTEPRYFLVWLVTIVFMMLLTRVSPYLTKVLSSVLLTLPLLMWFSGVLMLIDGNPDPWDWVTHDKRGGPTRRRQTWVLVVLCLFYMCQAVVLYVDLAREVALCRYRAGHRLYLTTAHRVPALSTPCVDSSHSAHTVHALSTACVHSFHCGVCTVRIAA
jgi:hypothetical protein